MKNIPYLLMLLPLLVWADNYDSQANLQFLFTTPAERMELDQLRNSGVYKKIQSRSKIKDAPVSREPLKVVMRGIVYKDGDKPVVWVNEGNTVKSSRIDEVINVNTSKISEGSTKVPVKIFNRTYKMKPGEVWTESDYQVKDMYQIK